MFETKIAVLRDIDILCYSEIPARTAVKLRSEIQLGLPTQRAYKTPFLRAFNFTHNF
jgi:hypothetical protein